MHGIFVTGTDTDVGKTYVCCLLAKQFTSDGLLVIPKKPVESGCRNHNNELLPADAIALKNAASYTGNLNDICQYKFEAALSPVRAANIENQSLTIEQLKTACKPSDTGDFILIEGAGGFYSPIAFDGLNADLAESLALPVLLVAEDRLGCINHILLTTEAISNRGLKLAAIVLNNKGPANNDGMDNAKDLSGLTDAPVYSLGHMENNQKQIEPLSHYLRSL